MSSEQTGRDELEALLPFYLNGTLSGDELQAVERWLASGPDAMAALAAAEAELSAAVAANEAVRPPADALTRFTRTLDQTAGPARQGSGASWLACRRASPGEPRPPRWRC
jgi:anti-sigma factor RsiW